MKYRMPAALLALLLITPIALAQNAANALRWGSDLGQAREEARKAKKPLMLWVFQNSELKNDYGDNIESDQRRAFADPRVVELSKRFVLSKISTSRYRNELAKMGVRAEASFDVLFATPSGELLAEIDPGGATRAESLAAKMAEASRVWRDKVFNDKLKAVIEGEKSSAKDVRAALDTVLDLTILSADQSLITLIEKQGVDEAVQARAIDVLGRLSTKPGVALLLQRAGSDPRAEKALGFSLPNVTEELLEGLAGEEAGRRLISYSALVKACKISNAKPEKFWEGKNQKVKDDEIKRVKDLAAKAAAKWRQFYAEYR